MSIPAHLKYTDSHEWVAIESDGSITVGITAHAQDLLGDIVFFDLPQVGREVTAKQDIAVVESVKAASDIYAPVSGTIMASNPDLKNAPEKVNQDPYAAWLFKIKPTAHHSAELANLLSAEDYQSLIDQSH